MTRMLPKRGNYRAEIDRCWSNGIYYERR